MLHTKDPALTIDHHAETGTTLANGTKLFVGFIASAAEGPAFALSPEDGTLPKFAAEAGEYADVLAGPPTRPLSRPQAAGRAAL